jgi:hypothetical protein
MKINKPFIESIAKAKCGLFANPDNWKVIENWIERHDNMSKVHLYTLQGMLLNYIADHVYEKESETKA